MIDQRGDLLEVTDELGQTPLMNAILLQRKEVVKDFISWGVDLNYQDKKKETALMKAVQTQNEEMVLLLLSNGAKVDIVDEKQETALQKAILNENEKISLILLDYNADALIKNNNGLDSYNLAMQQGKIKLAKVIQKKLADWLKEKKLIRQSILSKRMKKMLFFNEKQLQKD